MLKLEVCSSTRLNRLEPVNSAGLHPTWECDAIQYLSFELADFSAQHLVLFLFGHFLVPKSFFVSTELLDFLFVIALHLLKFHLQLMACSQL